MNGKIYIIHNNVSNKAYIGQTVQNVKARFNQHLNLKGSSKQLIYRAIEKYGRDNFYYEVLEEGLSTYDEINQREEYWIKKYNTLNPNGYNLCPGGQKWRRKPILSETQEQEIVRNYNNGLSARELSGYYNVTYKTVLEVLKKYNIQRRDRHHNLPDKTSSITKEIMIDLYIEKKMLIKDIAKQLNVNEKTIRRAKKRYELVRI